MNKHKGVKVIWNGKPLRDVYPHATKFQMFLYRVRIFLLRLFVISLLIGSIYGAFVAGGIYKPAIKYQEKEVILDNLVGKVNELKGELVSEIKKCESAGYSESEGLVTFDPNPNNKKVQIPSFGSYQFKKSTVQHYYKTLLSKDITGKEAILIALDDQKAGELATKIIFETENGLDNWYNCSNKLQSKSKLALINRLLK